MAERIGILTGGGDCPGLNAVIRAVARRSLDRGAEVVGVREGWRGLVDGLTQPLGYREISGILPRGGTIVGTSRTNPYKIEGGVEKVLATFADQKLDALVAIGGEDTLGVAARLHEEHEFPVVGVPKTIDNDLSATDYTFGFDTAVWVATEAIDRLHTTAESHNRVMVVEVMGRHTGWIAVMSGIAGGADMILIPEQPLTVEQACAEIQRRHERGKDFSIVVVSEGYELTYESGERRAVTQEVELDAVRPRPARRGRARARAGDREPDRLRDAGHGARARPAGRDPDAARPRARDPLRAQGGRPRRAEALRPDGLAPGRLRSSTSRSRRRPRSSRPSLPPSTTWRELSSASRLSPKVSRLSATV